VVRRILYTMFRLGLFDHVPAEGAQAAATSATNDDSIAMARTVAEEGSVLLKNASGVLPLDGPGKRTGSRAGVDVVQAYVGDPASVAEPSKQLEGFRRVSLSPGQSATLTIPLAAMSFAHWDTSKHARGVSAGTYQVMVGSSSRDIAGHGSVTLPAETP
jgi:beta-glucosidase-like glycosyl hydrolase